MPFPVRYEVNTEQHAFLFMINGLDAYFAFHIGSLVISLSVDIDKPHRSEQISSYLPFIQMLIATCYEIVVIIWIELESQNGEITCVSESNRSSLFPIEYLNGKRAIHSNGD